jgi:hypothetical protein
LWRRQVFTAQPPRGKFFHYRIALTISERFPGVILTIKLDNPSIIRG